MVAYYAMGGGLGHLVRADAFLKMQQFDHFKIITASPFANRLFNPDDLIIIPREFELHTRLLNNYMQDFFDNAKPESVIIDSFSNGILGELNYINWHKAEIVYVTRNVKWNVYKPKVISTVPFTRACILENLEDDHMDYISGTSEEIENLELVYPDHAIDYNCALARLSKFEKWFIVHSGPAGEVDLLMELAAKTAQQEKASPEIFVISQIKTVAESISWTDCCPAHGYFRYASRLFTACGFNIMNQTREFRDRHTYIPFSRKYDDQFRRASEAKK